MHTVLTNIIIYIDTLLHALIILQNGLKLNLLHQSLLKVLHTLSLITRFGCFQVCMSV